MAEGIHNKLVELYHEFFKASDSNVVLMKELE